MKRLCWVLALASLAATARAETKKAPEVAPLQRSMSSSQQFVIYHSDRAVRARLATKTEDLKAEWLRRMKLTDDWKAPIIIQIPPLRPANSPRMRTGVYESDGREMKIQIDVHDLSALAGASFEMEVVRALFLEYAYRNIPPKAGKAFQLPPPWLIEGFYEDIQARGEGIPPGVYEQLIKEGSPPKLEAFLKENPESMDTTSRAIYRARSLGLVRALLATPDGATKFAAYCSTLNSPAAFSPAKLIESFPSVAAQPSLLSKLWMLSLADASASNRIKPLPVAETQRRLSLILEISIPKNPKKPAEGLVSGPEALVALARTDSGKYSLRQRAEDLLRLEVRAHPLMKPIVEEYRVIASQLSEKPKRNVTERIRKNAELQQSVLKRANEVEDYLNWFEAAQLETTGTEFETSLDIDAIASGARRSDPLGRHLEDIEARGW